MPTLKGLMGLFSQPFMTLHLPPPGSFTGQTVLVTGSNTGLGLETARHIVALGAAKVILGVRSLSKGHTAKSSIEESTSRLNVVEVWEVDLESFASVLKFGERAKGLERLDIAVMNAGLASGAWNVTPDGYERALQVNVLSTALLSLLLLPILTTTKEKFPKSTPHLVVLGSDIHEEALLNERSASNILEMLNSKEHWEKSRPAPAERYAVSKLLEHYVGIEIASLVPNVDAETKVIVDIVAPGFCNSDLLTREPGVPFVLYVMQWLTGRTAAEGAKTVVDACVKGKEAHGMYLNHQKIAQQAYLVTSDEGKKVRKQVWSEILQVLEPVAPEIGPSARGIPRA